MGLLGGLGKILKGEPVFAPSNESGNAPQQSPGEPSSASSGSKVIPQVDITRVELPRDESTRIQVVLAIKNNSQVNVELEDIEALGGHKNLNDQLLRPGEEREFTVYDGPRPNSRHGNARIKLKDETGDYFTAHYTAEFEQHPDRTYSPLRFKPNGPVQDT